MNRPFTVEVYKPRRHGRTFATPEAAFGYAVTILMELPIGVWVLVIDRRDQRRIVLEHTPGYGIKGHFVTWAAKGIDA